MGSSWIYRGQSNDWPLLPPICRADAQDNSIFYRHSVHVSQAALANPKLMEASNQQYRDRYAALLRVLWAEKMAVRAFQTLADDLGFHVPSLALGETRYVGSGDIAGVAIDNHIPTQATALAQHHKVPTRLLNWTDHSFTAAHFAAKDWLTCPLKKRSSKIVIWAIDTMALQSSGCSLVIVRPERAPNPFMRAQRGLFTWHRDAEIQFMDTGKWPSHLDALHKSSKRGTTRPRTPSTINT